MRSTVAYVSSPLAAPGSWNLLAPLGSSRRHLPSALFVAQIANLAIMLALIAIGLGITDPSVEVTNLTEVLVWSVWWPFLVVTAFFAARLWCSMCHLRTTAGFFDKYGLKLKVPRILKRYGTTIPVASVLGIFVVHSIVVSYGLDHVPYYTAIFLAGLMVYAAGIGLVFEKNSFCKYFCPLVGVLGNYTRVSPTELRSADKAQCKRCKDKSCIKTLPEPPLHGHDGRRAAGVLPAVHALRQALPARQHQVLDAAVPAGPVAVAQAHPLGYVRRSRPARDRHGRGRGGMGAGRRVAPGRSFAHRRADRVRTHPSPDHHPRGIRGGLPLWEAGWIFVLLPLAILAVCGLVAFLLVRKHNPLEHVQIYALGFIPLILSLHAAKLVTAFNDAVRGLPHAIADPRGFATADAIAAGTLGAPAALVSPGLWGWLMMAFVAVFGLLGSLYVMARIARVSFEGERAAAVKSAIPFSVAVAALGSVAVLTMYSWLVIGGGG